MSRIERLVFVVVDASRSMGVLGRMRETKATILSLLVNAYQKRDRIALITFRERRASLALPPTRSVPVALRHLRQLTTGGATPLAHALALTHHSLLTVMRRHERAFPIVVLITDGRGNIAISDEDPWEGIVREATRLAGLGVRTIMIDTESGAVRLGLARRLAAVLRAPCYPAHELGSGPLSQQVQRALLRSLAG